jgi:addiction module RelE/StbE family toxin
MGSENYRTRYTPLAYEDLDEIDNYISTILLNPQAALNLLGEMEESINGLKQFPLIGSELEDPYLASKGYRKLVVQNYLVFHLVDQAQKEVIIIRVMYGAREYRSLL